MNLLGLDFGTKTVGVAACSSEGALPYPVETIHRKEEENLKATIRRIMELCAQEKTDLIVLGLPLNMDGTEGESARRVRAFQKRLSEAVYPVKVVLEDERLSTFEAEQPMIESGIKDRKKRKEKVDQLAAAVILKSYLNEQHREV